MSDLHFGEHISRRFNEELEASHSLRQPETLTQSSKQLTISAQSLIQLKNIGVNHLAKSERQLPGANNLQKSKGKGSPPTSEHQSTNRVEPASQQSSVRNPNKTTMAKRTAIDFRRARKVPT